MYKYIFSACNVFIFMHLHNPGYWSFYFLIEQGVVVKAQQNEWVEEALEVSY